MSEKFPEGLSYLQAPNEEEMTEETRKVVDETLEFQAMINGFTPNMFRVLPLNSELFRRWWTFADGLFNPEISYLSNPDKEMMGVVVSAENKCPLCLTTHAFALRSFGLDASWVELLTYNYRVCPMDERQRALCDFAYDLTTRPNEIEKESVDKLRAVGLNDHEIMEAIFTASYFNFSNRFSIAMGIVPDKEFAYGHRNPQPAEE
ncbi:MAG: peroxidase-related enzyme [Eggerthellaceae bacterium]|nr:peroxidase-related enzyme [Eggerthellaceae bacterium]